LGGLGGGMAAAAAAAAGKRARALVIGTHSGTFHADEALGCFLLRCTRAFEGAEVVRSRDPAVLGDLDCVLDVGGEYDPERLRFDHHQRGFSETFGHGFDRVPLSSAGLVYKHFGREIIERKLELSPEAPEVETVFLELYRQFVQAVDANDNGVTRFENAGPPLYEDHTGLGSRVAALNPAWNEPAGAEEQQQGFQAAMQLTGEEFLRRLNYVFKTWLPGRKYVQEAINGRHEVHPGGRVIRLPRYCPWKDHLYTLESELSISGFLLYCLFEDDRERKWRITCVSESPQSFVNRLSLPEDWRGLRGEELSNVAGIPGCIFVHANGFIGGNDTYEGALAMVTKALEMD